MTMINPTTPQAEETIVHTMDLPEGEDYVWFADCNLIGLASRLDAAGREYALAQALGRYASTEP